MVLEFFVCLYINAKLIILFFPCKRFCFLNSKYNAINYDIYVFPKVA